MGNNINVLVTGGAGFIGSALSKFIISNTNFNLIILDKLTYSSEFNSLKKILNKGRGAYYSSGSRPNQTPHSWGIARLASAITGGKSSQIDFHILEKYCKSNSKAFEIMPIIYGTIYLDEI